MTRRTVLSALPALAAAKAADQSSAAQSPATKNGLPGTSAPDYLAISAAQYKRNAEALAAVPVAIETEPAFHFKP